MRQSDGSEILGPNDPRNLVIGIIHVTPGDERQSVLTAISKQEKLGREQIILDLPAQNRAFKAAIDFEGLRQISGDSEAALVLIVPPKSKIANLARREGFTIYHSLEELTEAEFPRIQSDEPEIDIDETDRTQTFPVTPPTNSQPQVPQPELPLSATTPTAGLPAIQQPPRTAENRKKPGKQNQPQVPQPELPLSATTPTADLPAIQQPSRTAENRKKPGKQSQPSAGMPTSAIIPPQFEITEVQAIETPTDPALEAINTPEATPISEDDLQEQVSYLPVPHTGGALVPTNALPPAFYEPMEPPRRSRRGLLITAIIVVVLLGMVILFNRPILDLFFPPNATVTITPDSQQVRRVYQITGVLGIPDPTKDQVDARALYSASPTQNRTVKATGQGSTPGQQAQGVLTFYNSATTQQTIPEGTVIFDNNGLALVNENTIMLPAFDPAQGIVGTTDSAHTINVGNNQNIPAYDLRNMACCSPGIYVSNTTPFAGGLNAQNFTYVQQSDIDGVTRSLETTLNQQAITTLQSQVRANEKPTGAPLCAPQQTSNHQAGDHADTVTVSVTTTCMGEVYDMQAVQVLAARKLTQDARTNPGLDYNPVGQVLANVVKSVSDNHGNVLLMVDTMGVWAYQFTALQLRHFSSIIAGKSSEDAHKLLLQSKPGVSKATITLTGAGSTMIPGDTRRITINVAAVEGLHS